MTSDQAGPPAGRCAYGLTVHGAGELSELLPRQPWRTDHVPVTVRQLTGVTPPPLVTVDGRRGVQLLADGRHLALDRDLGTATFFGPALPPDLLVHPYLGPIATTFNRWAGRETFHAGAFVAAGRVWAVLGPRTAGKSSLLAALANRGVPVVADDILVVDSGPGVHLEPTAYAGPRCVDLRQPVPGVGLKARPVRGGTRMRVMLPGIAARLSLGGWLFLRWGDVLDLVPVSPATLLARLAAGRSWRGLASDPLTILAIAALPAWDLVRPRDWNALDATCELLETAVPARAGEPADQPVQTSGSRSGR